MELESLWSKPMTEDVMDVRRILIKPLESKSWQEMRSSMSLSIMHHKLNRTLSRNIGNGKDFT